MKAFLSFVSLLFVFAVSSLAFGQTPAATPFETIPDAVAGVGDAIEAVKNSDSWLMWISVVIGLVKLFWMVLEKVPTWKVKVVAWLGSDVNVIFGAAIAVLSLIQGAEWWQAIVVFGTGPLMGLLHDGGMALWYHKKIKKEEAAISEDG